MDYEFSKILVIEVRNNNNDWDTVEQELKIKFPNDYKKFIDLYGEGAINDFLWILSPFSEYENLNTKVKIKEMYEAYKILKNDYPELCEFEFYNDEVGIFPWGITDNGDELYWYFSKKETSIVVIESRFSNKKIYDMSMTEFLYSLVDKRIICTIFPDDFIGNENYYNL